MANINNPFALFRLKEEFELDLDKVKVIYQTLMKRVHPDQFAAKTAQEQKIAVQWATRIEEAYETLVNPVKRATFICENSGYLVNAESNTHMSMDFLVSQLELREEIEAAKSEEEKLALKKRIELQREEVLKTLTQAIDFDRDWEKAVDFTRRLMFFEKILKDFD